MGFEKSRRDFIKQGSLLVALSGGGALLGRAYAQAANVEAETTFGRVRGVDADGIKTFKGIPYGASTAGKNRFMPPVDPAKWTGVRDALAYGSSAPQRDPAAPAPAATAPGSRSRPRACRPRARTASCSTSGRRRSATAASGP